MIALDSFPDGLRACIFGASGGVGGALVQLLAAHPRVGRVYAGARGTFAPPPGVTPFAFDLHDEASITAACAGIVADGPLDLVVTATGALHQGGVMEPEKSWRALEADAMAKAFAVNTIGPALIAKHFLGHMAKEQKAVFAALSARVGSIGDNALGGWHAYRASKAALNMIMRNFAIELARRNPTAIAVTLHPGTVDTALSKPFQRGVAEGKLLTPAQSATYLLQVIDTLTTQQSGRAWAWDGAEIPF
jgi:NAD(P)-dependent dehydrogenase (short-subunit alcohol dehydrogenase family)